jgi:hypothetical protein
MLQQNAQLSVDLRPVRFQLCNKGKGGCVVHRPILDEALA